MCLNSTSLQTWFDQNSTDSYYQQKIPLPSDIDIALSIYSKMWESLDHNRRYCLNPHILAVEILERAGVGKYPNVKRFSGIKGEIYTETIDFMWNRYMQITMSE